MLELSNYSPPNVFVCDCICASINNFYLTDDTNAYECTITTILSHGS